MFQKNILKAVLEDLEVITGTRLDEIAPVLAGVGGLALAVGGGIALDAAGKAIGKARGRAKARKEIERLQKQQQKKQQGIVSQRPDRYVTNLQ